MRIKTWEQKRLISRLSHHPIQLQCISKRWGRYSPNMLQTHHDFKLINNNQPFRWTFGNTYALVHAAVAFGLAGYMIKEEIKKYINEREKSKETVLKVLRQASKPVIHINPRDL